MSLYIRPCGDWTKKLASLVVLQGEDKSTDLDVQVEGPYGELCYDIMSDKYKVCVFIAGGVGITHCLSVRKAVTAAADSQLVSRRKIISVWSVKDEATIQDICGDVSYMTMHPFAHVVLPCSHAAGHASAVPSPTIPVAVPPV